MSATRTSLLVLSLLLFSCARQAPCARTTGGAALVLRDRMSPRFVIEHVELALDDRSLIAADIAAPDPLARQWSVEHVPLASGTHTVRVYVRYRNAPWRYGAFAYTVGYTFHGRSTFTIDVRPETAPSRITIDAFERGSVLTELADRLALRCTLDEGKSCARSCGVSSETPRAGR